MNSNILCAAEKINDANNEIKCNCHNHNCIDYKNIISRLNILEATQTEEVNKIKKLIDRIENIEYFLVSTFPGDFNY